MIKFGCVACTSLSGSDRFSRDDMQVVACWGKVGSQERTRSKRDCKTSFSFICDVLGIGKGNSVCLSECCFGHGGRDAEDMPDLQDKSTRTWLRTHGGANGDREVESTRSVV